MKKPVSSCASPGACAPLSVLLAASLVAAGLLAGCAHTDPGAGWAAPRPLGSERETYRPPDGPPTGESRSASPEAPDSPLVTPDSLALGEALSVALLHNPELQSFAYEVRAREAERVQAGRWPNPILGVETENVTPGAPFAVNQAKQTGRLRQSFPLGGDAGRREDVAAFERDLAGWNYERTRLGVVAEVTRRFASVLAAQQRLALAGDLAQLADTLYQTVATQIEVGEAAEVEIHRVEVERAQARIERDRAAERLKAARQRLAATWGAGEARFAGARGTLGDTAPPPPLRALKPLARQNPRLARFEDELGRRAAQIDLEQARLVPDPQLTGGVQRFGGRDEYGLTAGLALPVPLFDRRQGAIEAAQYRLAKTRRARQEAHSEVMADLEDAYRTLTAAVAEVRRLRSGVLPSAQSAFEAYRRGYRLGKFGLVRLLDAQETLFEARLQQVRALEDYHRSAARVERVAAAPLERVASNAPDGDANDGNAPDGP